MQRNCCCNEKIAELRNLLIYSWMWEGYGRGYGSFLIIIGSLAEAI
jgi:hypothetical protein